MWPYVITLCIGLFVLPVFGGAELRASTVKVTLCELYEHPEKYAGTTVVVRASAMSNMSIEDFAAPKPCAAYMRINVELPGRADAAAGIILVRDGALVEFLEKLHKGMNVVATFEGRFDPVFVWRDHKRTKIKAQGRRGFKDDQIDGRIILQRVSDVIGRPRPRR
jgi:hypothetical protein